MPPKPTKKLIPLARNLRKQDTWAERLLWSWLRDRRFSAYKFRRQHVFGPHILDFFCVEAFLNIELDGSQHGFPEPKRKDAERDVWLAKVGVKVLRFWNARLRREKETVRNTIWRELQERTAHPLPDYCRPAKPAVGEDLKDSGEIVRVFPSPRPSPLGRGRTMRRLSQNPATGFAKDVSGQQKSSHSLSPLPQGEGQGEGKQGLEKTNSFSRRRIS